jgi:hypothetical protein
MLQTRRCQIILLSLAIPPAAQRAPLFKDEILPILEKSCTNCHNEQKKMAGLDLTTFSGLMAGGTSGPVIAPGKPERSLLWSMIQTDRMPMGGKLPAAQKQAIRAYIEQGRFPVKDMSAAQQAREAARITPEARNWWSFRTPLKAAPPAVKSAGIRTAIDRFIAAKLEERGWSMQPEADRITLLRRAYLDLTGLPPSPAEVKAFLADTTPDAYESLIDRLLVLPSTESIGAATGSTSPDIPIHAVMRAIPLAKSPGNTATTSSTRSIKTSPSIVSSWNNSPAINW